MFAITRGPSTKPACAPTKRSPASEQSVRMTNHAPTLTPPIDQWLDTFSARRPFIVLPSAGMT